MTLASSIFTYVFAGDVPPDDRSSHRSSDTTARSHDIQSTPDVIDSRDAGIVERLRAGDEQAMGELVSVYADRLTRFAYMLTGSYDAAEGFAYDVLAAVWEHRARLRPDRSIKTYLFTAVRHRVRDDTARRRVRERYANGVLALPIDMASVPSPDDVLIDQENMASYERRIAALRQAIATLADRRRLALHLRFEQGLSYPAMGEILGLSDKGAQQLVLRALDTLRRILGV